MPVVPREAKLSVSDIVRNFPGEHAGRAVFVEEYELYGAARVRLNSGDLREPKLNPIRVCKQRKDAIRRGGDAQRDLRAYLYRAHWESSQRHSVRFLQERRRQFLAWDSSV